MLQGFQVMADVLDGWGGFAVSYLQQLREDYPKTTVVTYGLSDDKMGKNTTMVKNPSHLPRKACNFIICFGIWD
jgi:hypothetical protein